VSSSEKVGPRQRWRVAVEAPQHVGLGDVLDYESAQLLQAGQLVRVPLGRREVLGLAWQPVSPETPQPEGFVLRTVSSVLTPVPPLPTRWCQLVAFAARYYQRSLGEVALAALPPELRKLDNVALEKNSSGSRKPWPSRRWQRRRARKPVPNRHRPNAPPSARSSKRW